MSADSGHSCPLDGADNRAFRPEPRSGWYRHSVSCQSQKVSGEHRCPSVRLEGAQPLPGAPGQPEAPFQEGDARLDSCAEPDKAFVYPGAARHLRDLHAAPLG